RTSPPGPSSSSDSFVPSPWPSFGRRRPPGLPVGPDPPRERLRFLRVDPVAEDPGVSLQPPAPAVDQLDRPRHVAGAGRQPGGVREHAPQLGEVVVVPETVGQVVQRLADVLHRARPHLFEQIDVVAQVLGALAPLVDVVIVPRVVGLRLVLAALAVDAPESRLQTGESVLPDRPLPDPVAQLADRPLDRRELGTRAEPPESGPTPRDEPPRDGTETGGEVVRVLL